MSNEAFAAIERVFRRVILMVGRGRIKTGKDDGNIQKLQVKLGEMEIRDNTPRMAEYGYTSMPPADTDAVLLFVGGDRSNGIIIATGNQTYRLRGLQTGEVALYDDQGQKVYLTRAGIVIDGAGKPVTIHNTPSVTADTPLVHTTGDVHVDGNLNVGGNIVAQGDISDHGNKTMAAMRSTYNSHKHVITDPVPIQQM